MKIIEPKGILHDTTYPNLNFIDLKEPPEQYLRPIFPRMKLESLKEAVRTFRKVLLLRWYPDILAFVVVGSDGEARLADKKEEPQKVSHKMKKRVRFLLDTYVSKKEVAKAMKKVGGGKPAAEFFDQVYEIIRANIRRSQ